MQIVPIPCLRDNYAYLVVCEETRRAVIIDPSEAAPIATAIADHHVTPIAIWNTHHHWDHIGGNKWLIEQYPTLQVVGHISDKGRIPGQTVRIEDGDLVTLSDGITARVIHNPGHTEGAVSYYFEDAQCVFTGDTLFAAGCGRMFEGNPAQMHASLETLASLPSETRVYCGHEYAESNLRFSLTVEPENERSQDRFDQLKHETQPSLSSTIGQERDTNPFLRTNVSSVISAASGFAKAPLSEPKDVFAALRRWKDQF